VDDPDLADSCDEGTDDNDDVDLELFDDAVDAIELSPFCLRDFFRVPVMDSCDRFFNGESTSSASVGRRSFPRLGLGTGIMKSSSELAVSLADSPLNTSVLESI
jgi:hypothetical protein